MVRKRCAAVIAGVVATVFGFAATAQATNVSISGGTVVDTIPQGTSGNTVLGPAGIELGGGPIYIDGTLDVLGQGARITLYDVGSESHWINEIWMFDKTTKKRVKDKDDFYRGTTGVFVHTPFQLAMTVTQPSGVARMGFWRRYPDPDYETVINGQSPMMMVPGYGYASIALAYLDDANRIVTGPTDRILLLHEDGGKDRDYDDYVGILVVEPLQK